MRAYFLLSCHAGSGRRVRFSSCSISLKYVNFRRECLGSFQLSAVARRDATNTIVCARSSALHCRWQAVISVRTGRTAHLSKAGPFRHRLMPHVRPFTTLLHPDQALTAEQAAGWVTDLIDCYSQSASAIPSSIFTGFADLDKGVGALYHDTLPEEALPGYAETLRSLLECAGALEQHLCGMCFFLPNQLSRAVVAIVRVPSFIPLMAPSPLITMNRFW